MATLIFLLSFLTLFVLIIRLLIKFIRRRPLFPAFKIIIYLVLVYTVVWLIFDVASSFVPVPLGTDVCFDDWCATITGIEQGPVVQQQFSPLHADSIWLVLNVRMSNHARGIAQKPSEPRIHVIDGKGNSWANSLEGQRWLEKQIGIQKPLDQKLELHDSIETKMVFACPAKAKGLKIFIDEGPFITNLLFPEDRMIFAVK